MANAIPLRELIVAVSAAVADAWSIHMVGLERPRTRQLALPYAVVWVEELRAERDAPFAGLASIQQTIQLGILGRFSFPGDASLNVELEKCDRVNELIEVLQTGPTFAGQTLPLVTRASFGEADRALNGCYEVSVIFEVVAARPFR